MRDVSFSLRPGEVLAVVGESGCGKSALCRAVMRLLPDSAAVSGEILVNGVDIAPYRERELQKLRGRLFSMVFQDPLSALNPSMTIGAQIAEAVRVHDRKAPREAVSARVEELMALVGIDRAAGADARLSAPVFRRHAAAGRPRHRAGRESANSLCR